MDYSEGIKLCNFAKQAQNKSLWTQSLDLYLKGINLLIDLHKKDKDEVSKSRAREIIMEQLSNAETVKLMTRMPVLKS